MSRISQIFAILVAVVITDAHWAVMQSITWAEMVSGNSGNQVATTIIDAISGERPCAKCCMIQEELESDQERQLEVMSKYGSVAPLQASGIFVPKPAAKKAVFHPYEFSYSYTASSGIDHPPRV